MPAGIVCPPGVGATHVVPPSGEYFKRTYDDVGADQRIEFTSPTNQRAPPFGAITFACARATPARATRSRTMKKQNVYLMGDRGMAGEERESRRRNSRIREDEIREAAG